MESAKLIADLTVFFVQTVKRVIEAVGKYGAEYDAASLEEFVAAQMRALGAVVLEYTWALRSREKGRPTSVECSCGRRRVFKGRAVAAPHEVRPGDRPDRLVTGVDGTMIGRVDPAHGRRSSAKKGRVRGKRKLANFWKEVKTCVVYKIDAAGRAAHDAFGCRVTTARSGCGASASGSSGGSGGSSSRCWTGITLWSTCGRQAGRTSARRAVW